MADGDRAKIVFPGAAQINGFVEQSAMPPACRAVSRQHGRVPCRRADPEVRLLTDYEKKRHVTNPAQHGDAEHTFGASSR